MIGKEIVFDTMCGEVIGIIVEERNKDYVIKLLNGMRIVYSKERIDLQKDYEE